MRAVEAQDLSRLVALTLRGATARVHQTHGGIAGRVFAAVGPAAAPVRRTHDAITGVTYAAVRGALGGGARVAGVAVAARASGRRLEDSPAARTALAILNGAHGDLLARTAPALATPLSVRQGGRDVPAEPAALAAAFPAATGGLAVFLHGLTGDEGAWAYRSVRHHGEEGVTYGSLLRRDLGMTPVYLRYNSGLHVSDNGRQLAALLGRLTAAWPVPVREVVLIGHSMGGLVARSALHQAGGGTPGGAAWTRLVRDTVTLGTPHLGAPLERGAHRLTHLLTRLPETRALASVLAARSAGIKDLRYGTVVAADWLGRDPDAAGRRQHTHVPLPAGARHFVVLATVPRDHGRQVANLVGDLLVPPRSATGDTGGADRLAFPADHVHRLGGLHHLDLLNHPRVYRQLLRWLGDQRARSWGGPAPAG
jgi:pimeloyl-ACP methyl ester carboxylesterase